MLYLLIVVGFLFFAGVAMTIGEGLWSNTITLLLVMISGIAAAITAAPLGMMLLEQVEGDEATAWYYVFGSMWGVFALSLLVLRILTDKASRIRVRFLPVVDKIGGILVGLFVAVMLASFAAHSLVEVPFKAGEWELAKATENQKSAFAHARNPFRVILKNFSDAEGIN